MASFEGQVPLKHFRFCETFKRWLKNLSEWFSIRNGFGVTPKGPMGPSPQGRRRRPWVPWVPLSPVGPLGSPWVLLGPKGPLVPLGSLWVLWGPPESLWSLWVPLDPFGSPWASLCPPPLGSLGPPLGPPKGSAPYRNDGRAPRKFGGGATLPERISWVGGLRVSVYDLNALKFLTPPPRIVSFKVRLEAPKCLFSHHFGSFRAQGHTHAPHGQF